MQQNLELQRQKEQENGMSIADQKKFLKAKLRQLGSAEEVEFDMT